MKTLFVVRHAKAAWAELPSGDHLRTLNQEGIADAKKIGQLLAQEGIIPDLVLSSSAIRAQETSEILVDSLDLSQSIIEVKDALYNASAENILSFVQSLESDVEKPMLIGHNPGISNFVSLLTNGSSVNMGACDVAIIELDIDSWQFCLPGKGFLSRYIENY